MARIKKSFLKHYSKKLVVLFFLLSALAAGLALLSQTQILQKKAEEGPLEVTFDTSPQEKIRRIWTGFAQGGEEKGLMLKPAENEIKKIQPQLIRIDHLFDFYEIVKKNTGGELFYDFSNLDQRVEEIVKLGATPFLSLSYFPQAFSPNSTEFPPSLNGWQALVQRTIQRYSGKSDKNLLGVYYEVWNEPDLFGKMSPETYFSLYESSAIAAEKCQDCNLFKIGGPAITTYKTAWMDKFLNLASQRQARLDFVSWHSYQLNPSKIIEEVEILKKSKTVYQLPSIVELVISEWGSVPEVSPLHDSYFDAAHTVSVVATVQNSVDKLLAFELKDGPSPEGKKYWGRWGLLTHEFFGLSPKPRFYSFLYLNKLLEFRLNPLSFSPSLNVIGSTDGKETYAIVSSRSTDSTEVKPLKIRLNPLLPGLYTVNIYSLDSLHNPSSPLINEVSFNGGAFDLSTLCSGSCVNLIELVRISPALVKGPGRSQNPNDFSAKLTSFVPPLVFTLAQEKRKEALVVDFWFKPNWSEEEREPHTLLESKNETGETLSARIDKTDSGLNFYFSHQGNGTKEVSLPFSWQNDVWSHIVFAVDNTKGTLSLKVDNQETSASFSSDNPIKLGRELFVGADSENVNYLEGLIDDLTITLGNEIIYQKDFNRETK